MDYYLHSYFSLLKKILAQGQNRLETMSKINKIKIKKIDSYLFILQQFFKNKDALNVVLEYKLKNHFYYLYMSYKHVGIVQHGSLTPIKGTPSLCFMVF